MGASVAGLTRPAALPGSKSDDHAIVVQEHPLNITGMDTIGRRVDHRTMLYVDHRMRDIAPCRLPDDTTRLVRSRRQNDVAGLKPLVVKLFHIRLTAMAFDGDQPNATQELVFRSTMRSTIKQAV